MSPEKELGALLFLYAETPLHAGSPLALGHVDLPIQRERMSNLPMLQSSGMKGALRELFRDWHGGNESEKDLELALFGQEVPEKESKLADLDDNEEKTVKEEPHFAGAMSVLDARLLLFPVRSVWGAWAWVTCPMIVDRLARDLELAGLQGPEMPGLANPDQVLVTSASAVAPDGRLILEDMDYAASPKKDMDGLAKWIAANVIPSLDGYKPFKERISKQLALISDQEFQFLAEHCTEVLTRVRIDPKTGTVADGALWSEECLPSESVLWTTAFFSKSRLYTKQDNKTVPAQAYQASMMRDSFRKAVDSKSRIRLGGDKTIGRGIVGVRLLTEVVVASSKGGDE